MLSVGKVLSNSQSDKREPQREKHTVGMLVTPAPNLNKHNSKNVHVYLTLALIMAKPKPASSPRNFWENVPPENQQATVDLTPPSDHELIQPCLRSRGADQNTPRAVPRRTNKPGDANVATTSSREKQKASTNSEMSRAGSDSANLRERAYTKSFETRINLGY